MLRSVLTLLGGLAMSVSGGVPSQAEQKAFRQRFEVEVPARGLVGAPPKREKTFQFQLSSAFKVVRDGSAHGAAVAQVNFGGLTEVRREFEATSNGVKLTWELKNDKVTPITGRKAFIILELRGERSTKMALSDKYRALRKRFLEGFYFQGRVAEFIDPSVSGGKAKFADQTIYMGQALLVFSTEMAVLKDSGQDASDARARIKQILDAIDELDLKADERLGGGAGSPPNGLFVRDDIDGPNDPRLGGRFKEVDSDWQNPEKENASPSGDQIFGLMYGLLGVVRYSGDDILIIGP